MNLTMLKPMLPTLVEKVPNEKDWFYEVKYDGFRCLLVITNETVQLISRNLKPLEHSFPEIVEEVQACKKMFEPYIPLILDGELVILTSRKKANFEKIQVRGRLKTKNKIEDAKTKQPACYLAFDILQQGKDCFYDTSYEVRKEILEKLFSLIKFPRDVDPKHVHKIQMIPYYKEKKELWNSVVEEQGEGLIVKKKNSKWTAAVRTKDWLKIKNWQYGVFFITAYEKTNGYFHVGLIEGKKVHVVGLFSHGLEGDEKEALYQIIKKNKVKEDINFIYITPNICIELQFLEVYKESLRHPRFVSFRLDVSWEECTWDNQEKLLSMNKSSI